MSGFRSLCTGLEIILKPLLYNLTSLVHEWITMCLSACGAALSRTVCDRLNSNNDYYRLQWSAREGGVGGLPSCDWLKTPWMERLSVSWLAKPLIRVWHCLLAIFHALYKSTNLYVVADSCQTILLPTLGKPDFVNKHTFLELIGQSLAKNQPLADRICLSSYSITIPISSTMEMDLSKRLPVGKNPLCHC